MKTPSPADVSFVPFPLRHHAMQIGRFFGRDNRIVSISTLAMRRVLPSRNSAPWPSHGADIRTSTGRLLLAVLGGT
jgi:hypothetical protein